MDSVKELIDKLVSLELNKGVTPVELAENIYNDDYSEIKLKKHFDNTICHVFFSDTEMFGDKKVKFEQIYIYDEDFILQEIQIKSKANSQILWNRVSEETKILDQIKHTLTNNYSTQQLNAFLNSLPEKFKMKARNLINKSS